MILVRSQQPTALAEQAGEWNTFACRPQRASLDKLPRVDQSSLEGQYTK